MKTSRFLIVIFLASCFVHLIPAIAMFKMPIGLDDMFQYDMLARSIVSGNGYRWYAQEDLKLIREFLPIEIPKDYDPKGVLTSFRGPGYPVFLALIYWIFGTGTDRIGYARVIQAIVMATLAPLTWWLAREMGFGEKTRRWAAVVMAFFPLLLAYPLALASENLFIVLVTLSLIFLLRANNNGRILDYALAGILAALTVLTRSIVSGFLVLGVIWLLWKPPDWKKAIIGSILFVLCFAVMTLPWAWRNSRLHGKPTWVETSLGYNLYMGYHPKSSGTFQFGISLDLIPILDDAERDQRGIEAAMNFIREDPARVPYLMIRKAGYMWGMDKRALIFFYGNGFLGKWPPAMVVLVFLLDALPMVILTPLASFGLVCGNMDRQKGLIALMIGYYTFIHMLVMADARFHIPLVPIIAVLAIYAVVEKPWRFSSRWRVYCAAGIVGLLFINWGVEVARDWNILVKLFGPEGYRINLPY